jgi:hypothetical protein
MPRMTDEELDAFLQSSPTPEEAHERAAKEMYRARAEEARLLEELKNLQAAPSGPLNNT